MPFQPTLAVFAQDYLPIAASAHSLASPQLGSPSIGGPGFARRASVVPGSSLGPISGPVPYQPLPSTNEVPTLANTGAAASGSAAGWSVTVVPTVELAEQTVRHVRVVQVVFGESAIELPEQEAAEDPDRELKSWTKAESLRRLREEMAMLVAEFEDVWLSGGGTRARREGGEE